MTKQYLVDVNEQGQIVGQPQIYTASGTTTKVVEIPKFIPYHASTYVWLGGIVVAVIIFTLLSIVFVKQQSIKIVERFGKFKKVMKPGLNFKIPLIDKVAGVQDLRIQQLDVRVETKTKDNVFVAVPVSVQYFVLADKAYDSFYKLDNPVQQISSYIFDTVRSQVPKMSLDDVFEKKEDIASSVKNELAKTMDDFGYSIVTALVTDIDPDAKVKASMNEINAQKRLREAATEKGEADKIILVKKAEAEAESKILQGKGIAGQRFAIAEGLKKSTEELKDVTGLDGKEVLTTIMLTQYFDTLKEIGTGGKVIFLNSSPSGLTQISDEIRKSIISANEAK